MARVRGNPRDAARHTGDLWSSGSQFVFDDYQKMAFGPWGSVDRQAPPGSHGSVLRRTDEYIVRGGSLRCILANATVSEELGTLGAFNFFYEGVELDVYFSADGSGNIEITIDDGTTVTTSSSTVQASTQEVKATMWGDKIYFMQVGEPALTSYDIPGDSFANEFGGTVFLGTNPNLGLQDAFFLDNNHVLVEQSTITNNLTVRWSVDSDPDGFSTSLIGSGFNPIKPRFGAYRGHVMVSNGAILFFEESSLLLSPTGTAVPAFRFTELSELSCPIRDAVASNGSTALFVSANGTILTTTGGAPRELRTPIRVDISSGAIPIVHYVEELDLALISTSVSAAQITYFIDLRTLEVVGHNRGITFQEHVITSDGQLVSIEHNGLALGSGRVTYDYTPGSFDGTLSFIETPFVDFGEDSQLLFVDVHTTEEDKPVIDSLKSYSLRSGAEVEETHTLVKDFGTFKRYAINRISNVIKFRISAENQIFEDHVGISRMILYWKPISQIEAAFTNV